MKASSGLRPAFTKDGSVTAANASGLNDGAAALVLMTADEAASAGASSRWPASPPGPTPGVDPEIMGTGPIPATRKALEKAGWKVADLDLIESNEAFAAQSLCVVRELGLDPAKVNVNGGAIAIGHPIGASGARILTTLLHEMQRRAPRRAWPPSASAAAWAWPCASRRSRHRFRPAPLGAGDSCLTDRLPQRSG